jgi:nitrogen fixation NifU-like protein
MMTEVVKGTAVDSVRTVEEAVTGWFAETDAARPDDLPEPLPALAAVKDFPARSRCVTLAWEALAQALSAAGEGQRSAAEHDS